MLSVRLTVFLRYYIARPAMHAGRTVEKNLFARGGSSAILELDMWPGRWSGIGRWIVG